MTSNQQSDIKELLEWVRLALANGFLTWRPSLTDQVLEARLDPQDVLYVLETSTDVRMDFAPGCYTLRGTTLDGDSVAVVVAEPSERNRINIVKVWRE